ncbi:hypothetical protein BD289DRAFT_436710 [Coniella lustricola]|uniref:Uncharacterized protein n=1 Tax=Coniella lustricola TaxID=2025994 RepID=A0A2T3A4T0_9PEZI|nr:hypothetical protein BD289DRAFT_436710 [Coniella lustricola]
MTWTLSTAGVSGQSKAYHRGHRHNLPSPFKYISIGICHYVLPAVDRWKGRYPTSRNSGCQAAGKAPSTLPDQLKAAQTTSKPARPAPQSTCQTC